MEHFFGIVFFLIVVVGVAYVGVRFFYFLDGLPWFDGLFKHTDDEDEEE